MERKWKESITYAKEGNTLLAKRGTICRFETMEKCVEREVKFAQENEDFIKVEVLKQSEGVSIVYEETETWYSIVIISNLEGSED